mmetsp:Transcript_4926/g.10345  ORF Transcript_4926/g.10345 Transcript_4926/m.10345 type:complete len:216 (+) Transcript_4926:115-762(+)
MGLLVLSIAITFHSDWFKNNDSIHWVLCLLPSQSFPSQPPPTHTSSGDSGSPLLGYYAITEVSLYDCSSIPTTSCSCWCGPSKSALGLPGLNPIIFLTYKHEVVFYIYSIPPLFFERKSHQYLGFELGSLGTIKASIILTPDAMPEIMWSMTYFFFVKDPPSLCLSDLTGSLLMTHCIFEWNVSVSVLWHFHHLCHCLTQIWFLHPLLPPRHSSP